MKILLGFSKSEAVERLMAYKTQDVQIQAVHTREQFLFRIDEDYDIVALHIQLFPDRYPWDWMTEIRQKKPDTKLVIALDDQIYDSNLLGAIERLGADLGITIIPITSTDTELAEELVATLFGKTSDSGRGAFNETGKVIALWSSASKDGASTVAINTALSLAKNTSLRIGLIDANLKNPTIRTNFNLTDKEKNNIKIRPRLQTNSLEPQELLNTCLAYRKMPNFHILAGTPRRETATDVTPEMIQNLMDVARRTFNITILDLNTYADNAATICGVRGADERWLVTQNNFDSYKTSWSEWYECYWKYCGIHAKDISLIVNRSVGDKKADYIADTLQMKLLAEIPNVGHGLGVKAVNEGVPLYLQATGTEEFKISIDSLASSLTDESEFTSTALPKGKRGWWSKLVASIN